MEEVQFRFGGYILMWCCEIDGKLTAARYKQFLTNHTLVVQDIDPKFILLQNCDPKHSAGIIKPHLQKKEESGVLQRVE